MDGIPRTDRSLFLLWCAANLVAFFCAFIVGANPSEPPELRFAVVTAFPLACTVAFAFKRLVFRALSTLTMLALAALAVTTRHWLPVTLLSISWLAAWLTSSYLAIRESRLEPARACKHGWLTLIAAFAIPNLVIAFGHANLQSVISLSRLSHLRMVLARRDRLVEVETAEGYLLRGTLREVRLSAPAVLLIHGRADHRERFAGWASELEKMGWNSLRIDLRANGRSDGALTTYGDREIDDVVRLGRFLQSQRYSDPNRMFAIGESMGGGLVLSASPLLAHLCGVILIAPASDYQALVADRLGPLVPLANWSSRAWNVEPLTQFVPREDFLRHSTIRTSPVPGLVFHSDADRVVPFVLSERLVAAAPSLTLIPIDGESHAQMPYTTLRLHWPRVRTFLRETACPAR